MDVEFSSSGKWPHHLCFADDVVVIANSALEVSEMLKGLNPQIKEVSLKINAGKMKAIQISGMPKVNLRVRNVNLEEVDSHVYLAYPLPAWLLFVNSENHLIELR